MVIQDLNYALITLLKIILIFVIKLQKITVKKAIKSIKNKIIDNFIHEK